MGGSKRLRGFTLVELLVVIGIIAVLVGILLPTLSKAREAANRAACGSNLRQVGTLLVMYANTYKGKVPLGQYGTNGTSATRQNNYFLTIDAPTTADPDTVPPALANGPGVRFVGLGLLYKARLLTGEVGKVFYCPSFVGDPNHDYNGTNNKWPPVYGACRASYSTRFGDYNGTFGGSADIVWTVNDDPAGAIPPFTPLKGISPRKAATMIVLSKMKGAAMVSDITSAADRLKVGHRNAMNVLYANGAVKLVLHDVYQKQLDDQDPVAFGQGNTNKIQRQLWDNLDKETQANPLGKDGN